MIKRKGEIYYQILSAAVNTSLRGCHGVSGAPCVPVIDLFSHNTTILDFNWYASSVAPIFGSRPNIPYRPCLAIIGGDFPALNTTTLIPALSKAQGGKLPYITIVTGNQAFSYNALGSQQWLGDLNGDIGFNGRLQLNYNSIVGFTGGGTSGYALPWRIVGGSNAGSPDWLWGIEFDAANTATPSLTATPTWYPCLVTTYTATKVYNSGAETARFAGGNLLVGYTSSNGAYKLQVNSQIFSPSSTIATSDSKYKDNQQPLSGALAMVNALRG